MCINTIILTFTPLWMCYTSTIKEIHSFSDSHKIRAHTTCCCNASAIRIVLLMVPVLKPKCKENFSLLRITFEWEILERQRVITQLITGYVVFHYIKSWLYPVCMPHIILIIRLSYKPSGLGLGLGRCIHLCLPVYVL